MSHISMRQVRATYKVRDSWWTVLLVDPVAGRLTRAAARRPWVTPNRLTMTAFLLGLGAAAAFLTGSPGWLAVGVLLYHVGFVIDCVDGKLARLTGSGSVFGGWLDFFLDRLRVMICVVALFAGQFLQTERPAFLFAAIGVVFLALFGYVNGAETDKARAQLVGRTGGPVDDAALLGGGRAGGFTARVRTALHRRRIRLNLISGIEFEMALLVVAPLVVAVTAESSMLLWVTAVAAALLLLFEAALIFRFWLATRQAARVTAAAALAVDTPAASSGAAPPGAASPDTERAVPRPATGPEHASTAQVENAATSRG